MRHNRSKTMDMSVKSEFNFGGQQLTLQHNTTSRGHLYSIEKALWPQMCAEVAASPQAAQVNKDTALPTIWDLGEEFLKTNEFYKAMGEQALNALTALGYDRSRMARAVQDWLGECFEKGIKAMQSPEIWGPKRFQPRFPA